MVQVFDFVVPADLNVKRAMVWLSEPARVTSRVLPFKSAMVLIDESFPTK